MINFQPFSVPNLGPPQQDYASMIANIGTSFEGAYDRSRNRALNDRTAALAEKNAEEERQFRRQYLQPQQGQPGAAPIVETPPDQNFPRVSPMAPPPRPPELGGPAAPGPVSSLGDSSLGRGAITPAAVLAALAGVNQNPVAQRAGLFNDYVGNANQAAVGGAAPRPFGARNPADLTTQYPDPVTTGMDRANEDELQRMAQVTPGTSKLIQKFEGYRGSPYFDVNGPRVGFGSDTVTDPGTGQYHRTSWGDRVTPEMAQADLMRRANDIQAKVIQTVGVGAWSALSQGSKDAVTSVGYNYGTPPRRVMMAIASGNETALARSIESLPANPGRRRQEAALVGTGGYTGSGTSTTTRGGGGGGNTPPSGGGGSSGPAEPGDLTMPILPTAPTMQATAPIPPIPPSVPIPQAIPTPPQQRPEPPPAPLAGPPLPSQPTQAVLESARRLAVDPRVPEEVATAARAMLARTQIASADPNFVPAPNRPAGVPATIEPPPGAGPGVQLAAAGATTPVPRGGPPAGATVAAATTPAPRAVAPVRAPVPATSTIPPGSTAPDVPVTAAGRPVVGPQPSPSIAPAGGAPFRAPGILGQPAHSIMDNPSFPALLGAMMRNPQTAPAAASWLNSLSAAQNKNTQVINRKDGTYLLDMNTGQMTKILAPDNTKQFRDPTPEELTKLKESGYDPKTHGPAYINTETGEFTFPAKGTMSITNQAESTRERLTAEYEAGLDKEIRESNKHAGTQLVTNQQLRQIMNDPDFAAGDLGKFQTVMRRVGATLGITDSSTLAPNQLFEAISGRMVTDALGGKLGAGTSDRDVGLIKTLVPQLGNSQEANRILLDIRDAQAKREQEIYKASRVYLKKNGKLDSGWDDIRSEMNSKPLFTDAQYKDIDARAAKASAEQRGSTAPGATKIPKFITGPDGELRQVQ